MPTKAASDPSPSALDRAVVVTALVVVCLLAWGYLAYMAWGMEHMDVGADMAIMPRMVGWRAADLALVFIMWAVMMTGMMLPSAAPMILLFVTLTRRRNADSVAARTIAFMAGYLIVWTLFSFVATLAQWQLLEARLVSPMMDAASPLLGGVLLIAAGLYQFTALKRACLALCQSPLIFLATRWRDGLRGAWQLGMHHGLYCTGCCWMLMLLLFVLGVMNLFWIAALAALVLIEKMLPRVRWVSPVSGVLLIVWGAGLLARHLLT